MISKDKRARTPPNLSSTPDPAAVLAAFGIAGRVSEFIPVVGGWSNRIYRLATGSGAFAVKQMLNPWQEPRWQDWLASAWEFERLALSAGVAVPEPVPSPADGGCLAWMDSLAGDRQVPVRMHRWVGGAAPGPGPVTPEVATWAGAMLARLHLLGVRPADRGLFPSPGSGTADNWPDLARAAGQAGAPWAREVAAAAPLVAWMAGLAGAGPQASDEVMSHGDVDQKNLLLTGAGPVLCDWDLAVPLVPRHEVADVALSLAAWRRDAPRDQGCGRERLRSHSPDVTGPPSGGLLVVAEGQTGGPVRCG